MSLKGRYERNTGDKPDAIPPGDRFIASGQQQSPGRHPGPAPGERPDDARDEGTPIPDQEPRATANPSPSRPGDRDV